MSYPVTVYFCGDRLIHYNFRNLEDEEKFFEKVQLIPEVSSVLRHWSLLYDDPEGAAQEVDRLSRDRRKEINREKTKRATHYKLVELNTHGKKVLETEVSCLEEAILTPNTYIHGGYISRVVDDKIEYNFGYGWSSDYLKSFKEDIRKRISSNLIWNPANLPWLDKDLDE